MPPRAHLLLSRRTGGWSHGYGDGASGVADPLGGWGGGFEDLYQGGVANAHRILRRRREAERVDIACETPGVSTAAQ